MEDKTSLLLRNKKKAGYEYLLAYKLTVPIYDYTMEFVKRWIDTCFCQTK